MISQVVHRLIAVLVIALLLPIQGVAAGNAIPPANQPLTDEQVNTLAENTARGLADELIFENIASLAGSACSLYGVGIDLVNIAYDGQFSLLDSILEISVLFRNEPWRELIWAINDQREEFVKQLVELKKRRCQLGAAFPESLAKDQEDQRQRLIADVEKQIAEYEAKVDYYSVQRMNMLFDRPHFGDFSQIVSSELIPPELEIDKIFYLVGGFTSFEVNWDQFIRSSWRTLQNSREDLTVVTSTVPQDCFAVVTVGHELEMYFAHKFRYENGVYRDDQGREFQDFRGFVEGNGPQLVQQYIEQYCQASRDRALAEASQTSAEQQFLKFRESIGAILTQLGQQLNITNQAIQALESRESSGTVLSETEQGALTLLRQDRGRLLAMQEYHQLVLQKVGSSESQSLENLTKSLESFVSAVVGVIEDDNNKKKSRISLAERFEKANERSLQKICGRIEAMYREAGRSTADLPFIGFANGERYCKATTECADVGLDNLLGGSEGRRKLAECSGFLFDGSELGPSQLTEDVIEQTAEDLSLLLEQGALNDLLKQRTIHFQSLRSRYDAMYGSQSDTTAILEQIIQKTALDLYNPAFPEVYRENTGSPNNGKTHYGLMRKVYQDFWKFLDEQEGSCSAPEEPSF